MKSYLVILIAVISLSAKAENVSCENPQTTVEMNICSSKEAAAADTEMENYFEKAMGRFSSEPKVIEAIKKSQEAWLVYRKANCDAVYELWSTGTIRGAMYNGCLLHLTKQRTHNIWANYLRYGDSTEPLLPEPQ